ncbi:hypothetical protein GCM10007276_32480 [Agaricicola taiwanensis]|uniref:Phosphonate metabolism protein n=1 Tax=Agaricicola taiwanensis TaxID=591372 RepID=A0A8J2YME1_9RHOB|nr:DUF1045 domain-containing protein [Agaricicola taiwanensis]GGE52964.1 hypothetical protein GCM10007276_32480 [Agaricicola taiwanensis]
MRYAVYYAPERKTDLWRFGCRVLGRDPETGEAVAPLMPDGIDAGTWTEWTASPRRYGFHATLKAPFALAEDRAEAELDLAVADFAAGRTTFRLPRLKVAALGRFVALIPAEDAKELELLAADCVRAFDHFRAPLTAEALAKRLAAPLSPSEHAHLRRWGYPYVFQDFQFHMTLTGALPEDAVEPVARQLHALYEREMGAEPMKVESVAVFMEPKDGATFRLVKRFRFKG